MTGADELERIICEGRRMIDAVAAEHPAPPGAKDNALRDCIQAGALSRAAVLFGEHKFDVGIDLVVLAAQAAMQLAVSSMRNPDVASSVALIAKTMSGLDASSDNTAPRMTEAEIDALSQDDAPATEDST